GQHTFNTTGPKTVKLTVTSKDGCVDDTTKTFTVNSSQPVAGFSMTTSPPLCSNRSIKVLDQSSISVGAITSVEIYWDFTNNPLDKTVDSNAVIGKTYTHQYTAFGTPAQQTHQIKYYTYSGGALCVSSPVVQTITLLASPKIQFDTMLPVCAEAAPYTITSAKDIYGLTGSGVYTGAGISASGFFSPAAAQAGTHAITYTYSAANGCSDTATRNIIVWPTPIVDAGPDRYLLEGGSITLLATASGNRLSYLWDPAQYLDNPTALTPASSSPVDITYTLTATSADGCTAGDDVFVKILKNIKVPNAFSPNGDGINDTWVIEYLDSYPGCTVDVFNRYGQTVFHSTGY
ncbi:MAG: gliding motility-associated C-terminal domain-containing protein, partial [Bacteroidetes bacterium]|nr:gliding motility-associated C-terminal domain-containing protein [Bacteroidota bacterium]